jgi:spore maturation protein CgeB
MGHDVHVFEFVEQALYNKDGMNDFFLSAVRRIGYDLVFIETSQDEFYPEVLDEARRYAVLLAWNSDDDWRWETYSSKWVAHYTYMVTTYRHVYEANRASHPNLLLSQWACTGLFDGTRVSKDIPISFVGSIYPERADLINAVRSRLRLRVFSRTPVPPRSWLEKGMRRLARALYGSPIKAEVSLLSYEEVNDIWNRSLLSLTPLRASRGGHLQIKGRVFEMALSGTVMLCDKNPDLYEFYEPEKEFVEFESVEDCCERARYLLAHETQRRQIAEAYRRRTLNEHMWIHRYQTIFDVIGLRS